jgi:hypothetical protein
MRRYLFAPILVFAALSSAIADDRSLDVTKPPPLDQFLILPLRVHVLTGDAPEVDCKLTDADVERIVTKANRVWSVAGVHFGIESVVREPAARVDEFKKIRDDNGGSPPLNAFRLLRPDASRAFDGLHVYYVHKMPVNGVWMGGDFAFVQETARLREVEGGIDEPVPRVTSHELGHALGLPHRQDRTNLMASGTTGTLLNADEVKTAREKALHVKGAARFAECAARTDARSRKWAERVKAIAN